MSTAELKEIIIKKISAVNDEQVLAETLHYIELEESLHKSIAELVEIEKEENDKRVYQFSEEETEEISNILKGKENGGFVSHEEANREFQEWLKK